MVLSVLYQHSSNSSSWLNLSGSNEVPAVPDFCNRYCQIYCWRKCEVVELRVKCHKYERNNRSPHSHGKQGENGPVVVGLFNSGMVGPPTGKENGVLAKGNITSSDLQGTMPGKQISDLVDLMKSHGVYVSINTATSKWRLIRGQVG